MDLYLRDNDPTRTLLITASGEELYKIETYGHDGGTSVVLRFERHSVAGLVALEVGKIERLPPRGTKLLLYAEQVPLILRAPANGEVDNSWAFVGPDGRSYKWQLLIRKPVLILNDNSLTPIARYRRAKLGIVSRSRRGFLEILPAGVNIVDLVVVTFVSFAKQTLLIEPEPSFST